MRMGDKTRSVLLGSVPYRVVIDSISDAMGMPVMLAGALNPPGFHIFANYTDSAVTINLNNWHKDLFMDKVVDAWIVPIELPSEPCGVDYLGNQRYNYAVNTLCGWKGDMPHSISAMTIHPGERRITLQCFTVEDSGSLYLFW